MDVKVQDMVHMPGAGYNLFSLTKRLDQGWSLGGDSTKIWLHKRQQKTVFDIKMKMPKGIIYTMYIKCKATNSNKMATMGTDKSKPITEMVAHALMGHINETDSQKAIKYLMYDIARGAMNMCQACAEAKAKHLSLPTRVETKTTTVHPKIKSNIVNERLSFDIFTIKAPAGIRTKVSKP
eukprot:15364624-Ditylum_brightwellii.AAC.3